MGLFDFFSKPPPLEDRFRNALSVHFREDDGIIEKLARAQSKLSQALAPDEEILLITHSRFDAFDQRFMLITNKRVFSSDFDKGKPYKQLPNPEIEEIKRSVERITGDFSLRLVGRAAMPYAGIPFTEMGGRVQDIWLKNTIDVYAPKREILDEFENMVRLAQSL
jgi:hypothetical protein